MLVNGCWSSAGAVRTTMTRTTGPMIGVIITASIARYSDWGERMRLSVGIAGRHFGSLVISAKTVQRRSDGRSGDD